MIFKIEVDDFWLDDNSDLEPALKKHIINKIIYKISEKYKKQIEEKITSVVVEEVNDVLKEKILAKTQELIKQEKIYVSTTGYNSDKENITIEDYIKKTFVKESRWGSPNETISALAKTFSKELKERYDIMFASHIVSKINEVGLLKEGAENILLENNGDKENK